MKSQVEVFWFVTPCSGMVGYQRFGETFCLHLQGKVRIEAAIYSDMLVLPHPYTVSETRRIQLNVTEVSTSP